MAGKDETSIMYFFEYIIAKGSKKAIIKNKYFHTLL